MQQEGLNPSSRTYGRARVINGNQDGDVDGNGCITYTSNSQIARARAYERFYDPIIENEIDLAVDHALTETGGSRQFRSVWRFYCREIGINTFLDQLDVVLSCHRQGEIKFPARAFHARIREMKTALDFRAKKEVRG